MNSEKPQHNMLIRWVFFLPTAFFAFITCGHLWEWLFDLLVYVFWPNTSKTLGPDDLELYNEITSSKTYTYIRSFLSPIICTGVFFYIGSLFFHDTPKNIKLALVLMLITLFINYAGLLTHYISQGALLSVNYFKDALILSLLSVYFTSVIILWYRFFKNKHKDKTA